MTGILDSDQVRDRLRDAIYFFEFLGGKKRRRRRGSEAESYMEEAKRTLEREG